MMPVVTLHRGIRRLLDKKREVVLKIIVLQTHREEI